MSEKLPNSYERQEYDDLTREVTVERDGYFGQGKKEDEVWTITMSEWNRVLAILEYDATLTPAEVEEIIQQCIDQYTWDPMSKA